ncbi:zinc transporter ZIP13 homolog isoform X2 [Belonocnema kinseyi]|uniref:zinc transporter ZIP13 homolog isoform X2 n=1 Tax=Belonocnema kinseyi TaxID=2817044 RepID=UPI00143DBE40|nr:zinc transporter ZIP13 homolog isoform X2 [Belonocnema kinseyi]
MSTACMGNCSNPRIVYDVLIEDPWAQWNAAVNYFEYQPWVFSLLGSAMVGLSGILPLLIIPIDDGTNLKNGGAGTLKSLLSFAVGGLLGDVFLHLLPEAWARKALSKANDDNSHPPMTCGLWVLAGFLIFIIAEKMFINDSEICLEEKQQEEKGREVTQNFKWKDDDLLQKGSLREFENNNCLISSDGDDFIKQCKRNINVKDSVKGQSVIVFKYNLNKGSNVFRASTKNGTLVYPEENLVSSIQKKNVVPAMNGVLHNGSHTNVLVPSASVSTNESLRNGLIKSVTKNEKKKRRTGEESDKPKHVSGYLNLMANCIDNFTHGLAVGGSFLISFRLGALTTFAILVHEIPHEVGDFAILLRSGFNRWDAARAQLLTATGGIFGALVAVLFSGSGVESRTSWILPFTAGGFLHIGMVSVLPELLKETNPKESLKQLGALLAGITIMAFLTVFFD